MGQGHPGLLTSPGAGEGSKGPPRPPDRARLCWCPDFEFLTSRTETGHFWCFLVLFVFWQTVVFLKNIPHLRVC